jgi:hypothetical protein
LKEFEEIKNSKGQSRCSTVSQAPQQALMAGFSFQPTLGLTKYATATRWLSTALIPYNLELRVGTHHNQTTQAHHFGRHR